MDLFQILSPVLFVIGLFLTIIIFFFSIFVLRLCFDEICFLCEEGWQNFKNYLRR